MRTFFYIFFILCSIASFSQTTLTVDWVNNNKHEVTYKKKPAASGMNGFKDAQQTGGFLDIQASFGMTIHNGIRNLLKDPETNELYQTNGELKKTTTCRFYIRTKISYK